jgi:hypothetical protein
LLKTPAAFEGPRDSNGRPREERIRQLKQAIVDHLRPFAPPGGS